MTVVSALPDAPDRADGTTPASRVLGRLAFLLLLAFLAVVAWLPDEALLRSKAVWGVALLHAAAGVTLAAQAATGRVRMPWPEVLAAALMLPLLAVLHLTLRDDLLSRSMAQDELRRLFLLPLGAWTAGVLLADPRRRSAWLACLHPLLACVAGYALVQHLAYELGLPLSRIERPPSTFGNPVFLAAFLVLTTPLSVADALFGSGWRRWSAAVAAGLAMPALLATQSRWAWLGFSASIAAGTVLLARTPRARHRLLAALVLGGLVVASANLEVLERPQRHALIWRDTWSMAADAPWGVGPGQYPLAFLPYASAPLLEAYPRSSYIVNDAHSEPLQVLAELGWPGLLSALALVALGLRAGRRALDDHPPGDPDRPVLAAALAAPVGALVQSVGSPDLRFLVSTLMIGTVVGTAASLGSTTSWRVPAGRAGRSLLVVLGLGLAGYGVYAALERRDVAALLRPTTAAIDPAATPPGAGPDIRALREQAGERPHDAQAQYALGLALAEDRRFAEAAEQFRRSAVLSPGHPEIIRSLGVAEGLSGQFQSAFVHLRALLTERPDDHDVRYLLAYVAWRRGDIDTAVRQLETLLAAVPGHRQAKLLLERLRE